MSPQCLSPSFGSIRLTIQEQMGFQDGHFDGHLGYWNRTILAILNLYVTNLVSAQYNLRFGRGCRLKNFKMAVVAAILDFGTERF